MSYSSLYKLSWVDQFDLSHEVYVKERDYAGSQTEIDGGARPWIPSLNTPSDGKFEAINGGSAILRLKSATDEQFEDLFTSDWRKYKVEHYISSTLDWSGWILPDLFQEPYEGAPYIIDILCADGLGSLKNYDYSLATEYPTLMAIITHCLDKIELSLNIYEAINIYEENHSSGATDSPLTQTYVKGSIFSAMNCYDVLTEVLKICGAEIRQNAGSWHITRIKEKMITFTRRLFNSAGVYQSQDTKNPNVTLTTTAVARAALVRIAGRGVTMIEPAWKQFTTVQDYGISDNMLDNGDFEDFDNAAQLSDWTNADSVTYEKNKDGVSFTGTIIRFPIGGGENIIPSIYQDDTLREADLGQILSLVIAYSAVSDGSSAKMRWELEINTGSLIYYYDNYQNLWTAASRPWNTTTLPEGDSTGTIEISTTGLLQTGTLRVRLFEDYYDSSQIHTSTLTLKSCKVTITASDEYYDETEETVSIVNPDNNYVPEDIALMLGDGLGVSNEENISDNILLWDNAGTKTPTTLWTENGVDTSRKIAEILRQDMAQQYAAPSRIIKCNIFSKLIDYQTVIVNKDMGSKEFMISRADYDAKMGMWDVEMIELPTWAILGEKTGKVLKTKGGKSIVIK